MNWMMTNQQCGNMSFPLFSYLHTLFFDELPLHLTAKKLNLVQSTWPSPAMSFNSLQELVSVSITQVSYPASFSSFPLTLHPGETAGLSASLTSEAGSGPRRKSQASLPGHVVGTQHSLHPSQPHCSLVPSYPMVGEHICQPSLQGSSWQEVGTSFVF